MNPLSAVARRVITPAGLRRPPVLTAIVFAATAVTSLTQFAVPGMLNHLERTPAELHGQGWRVVTALFVQDGGAIGTVSNLVFLAVIGATAEQALSRPRWLLHYLGVGLASELIGYAWQPVGAGNSIAVCGLTGALALALWRGDARLPAYTPLVLAVWCGALLGTMSPVLLIPAVIVGSTAGRLAAVRAERGGTAHRTLAAAVPAVAVVLAIAHNIHGGALLLGLVLAPLTILVRRRPEAADPAAHGGSAEHHDPDLA